MKVRIGIDIACRSAHHAACADGTGRVLWQGHRFRTSAEDLEALWAKVSDVASEVMVVMEPTRNAWVPLAAWFRRRGAQVVIVPAEQSADLRDYYSKHTKTDRLDAVLLARLPVLHPEGLRVEAGLGPGDPLKRAVKLRSNLVHRRCTAMHRLDALLELLGPGWVQALGSDMTKTAFRFLAQWAHPHQVKRIGRSRLARWLSRSSRGAWSDERAGALVAAAQATIALWGPDGLDYDALAADIAVEAKLALALTEQIDDLDDRIADLYATADPDGILLSAPGVGPVLAAQILGRLGDPHRFASLSSARSFSGLVPRRNSSGLSDISPGISKQGDACLREALFTAAEQARRYDPQLAARYHRLVIDRGKHHNAAVCTVATVLLTRVVACLRTAEHYQLRDTDGRGVSRQEGRAIVTERFTIPHEVRVARRRVADSRMARRNERTKRGVA